MAKRECAVCHGKYDTSEVVFYEMVVEPCTAPAQRIANARVCFSCARSAKSCRDCGTQYAGGSATSWLVNVGVAGYCRRIGCLDAKYWRCGTEGTADHHGWVRAGRVCEHCGMNSRGVRPRCMCGQGESDAPIHNYSCQPLLVFHDVGGIYNKDTKPHKMFLGFELEIQIPSIHIESSAKLIKATLQTTEIAQSKSDGSIGGGIELVTQPHTYAKYREQPLLFETIDRIRNDYGGRSWDPGTCGFHIHLGRDGFENGAHMHRFVEFVYRNADMMMKFGGRKSGYAKFDDCWDFDEFDRPFFSLENKGLKGKSVDERGGDKYAAVNTGKTATIEMRFMRGSTKKETILSYLGMADAIVNYTKPITISDNWWDWESFGGWVTSRSSHYPELFDRMPSIKDLKISELDKLKIKA